MAVPVASGARRRIASAALVTAVTLAVVSPWTARNLVRMDRVVLVSANGGWNLLIGSVPGATGTFVPIEGETVPAECRIVFGEAAKDACFGRAALDRIASAPLRWIALMPTKLSFTFDYSGAPGWYLHASNPRAFPESAKVGLGVAETVWQRLLVALALLALWRAEGPRKMGRAVLCGVGTACLFTQAAWISHALLVCAALCLGKRLAAHPPAALAGGAVAVTALTHAVFFGAGRYSLVIFPLVGALAGASLSAGKAFDRSPAGE
jgi:hypothetical protein